MLIDGIIEEQKLRRARVQPHLWFTAFSITDVLQEVRACHFRELEKTVDIYAVNRGSLACIVSSETTATIYLHQIVNHNDTPAQVISLLCKHELLHLQIGAAEVNGKKTVHPPEFWEAEKRIAPERSVAWGWIWISLGLCLKRRPKLERIDVLPSWREVWNRPKLSLADCISMCRSTPVPTEAAW